MLNGKFLHGVALAGIGSIAIFGLGQSGESKQPSPPEHSYSLSSFRVKGQDDTSRTIKAHVVKATLANNLFLFPYIVPNKIPKTVADVASELERKHPNKIVAVINAGFFEPGEHGMPGQSFAKLRSAEGMTSDGDLPHPDPKNPRRIRHAHRSFLELEFNPKPRLVQNAYRVPTAQGAPAKNRWYITGGGQILPDLDSPYSMDKDDVPDPYHDKKKARTAIGWALAAPNKVALVTVSDSDGVTIPELQRLMKQIRVDGHTVDTAMAFDGGGSTSLWYKGTMKCSHPQTGSPGGRPVITMLVLKVHFF